MLNQTPLDPDRTAFSEDWTKHTWDFPPGAGALPLLLHLDVFDAELDEQRAVLAEFLRLPVARSMPREYRNDLLVRGIVTKFPFPPDPDDGNPIYPEEDPEPVDPLS